MAELPKVIVLKSLSSRYDEGRAAEAITPGHLVVLNSAAKLVKHATAGGKTGLQVAREDRLQGKTISDVYAVNDLVPYQLLVSGDEAYCWLAAGQTIAVGAKLESAGDGTFRALAAGSAVAEAVEAVTTVGSPARIKVRAL